MTIIAVGSRVGRLTVLAAADPYIEPKRQTKRRRWHCRCECGERIIAHEQLLKRGHTQSCGCLQRERTSAATSVHGYCRMAKRSKEYRVWEAMHQRCGNPNANFYGDYGGRGIRICSRWDTFENFLADMGERPGPKHTIDRIDNNGHYEPENCRWATKTEQSRNRRGLRMVMFRGRQLCLAEALEITGVSRGAFDGRIKRGWSVERALAP